jgi:hypothetical protein
MSLIETTLKEWTSAVAPGDRPVAVFRGVRDIPLAVGVPPDPERTLRENAGNCLTKHIVLKSMLDALDMRTCYGLCTLRWEEQAFLPDKLRQAAVGLEPAPHLFTYFRSGEEWRSLDATYDPGLAAHGFPVNDWDGRSATPLPFKLAAGPDMLESLPDPSTVTQSQGMTLFYETFAGWLKANRPHSQ